ncbi:MAG: gliding motility lipoprotein GldH [Ekhidna sp.]
MKYVYLLIISILIFSCDSSRVYEDFNDMEDAFWHIDSVQTFDFKIEDTTRNYNVLATFRNASSYPFYNLYFQYSIADSLGNVLTQELKEVTLFNAKTGEPYGDGLGDLFDHAFPVQENYTFPRVGSYSIQFQQFMRMDTLPFIMSVGGRVEFAEAE